MAGRVKIAWDSDKGPAENARRELPRIVSDYFAEGRRVLSAPRNAKSLHRLRLASKKLRYTLELFRPCYPAGFEDRLAELKKLQDWLGASNDASVAATLVGSKQLKKHPEVRESLEKRSAAQASAFVRYWKRTFDADGQEAWWTDFLATKAREPKAARKSAAS
jgi:CHAD domain-containing protein